MRWKYRGVAKFVNWNLDIRSAWTMETWFYTRNVASFQWRKSKIDLVLYKKWSDNRTGWADPKVLKGMLVSDLGNEKKGELDMNRLSSSKGELPFTCDLNRYNTWEDEIDHTAWFCNHKTTYPTYLPSIFSSFVWVHLDLQTLIIPFFFLLSSYINLHLFLPRARIKQLGSFVSLPIYKSAKIKLFGLQLTENSSKMVNSSKFGIQQWHLDWPTFMASSLAFFWKYGALQHAKYDIFGTFNYQSWKMNTCCNRRLIVAPLWDGFSLWKAKNSRSDCLDLLLWLWTEKFLCAGCQIIETLKTEHSILLNWIFIA